MSAPDHQASEPIIRVENLVKEFAVRGSGAASTRAVDDISFQIGAGETLGLVGESGSGKSTTGYCALRLIAPTAGRIVFGGRDITSLGERQLRPIRRHMQIIFQDPYSSLDPRMSIGDIIAEPLRIHGVGSVSERLQQVISLLDVVGISSTQINKFPREFSGGQRQRVGIARALALNPQLIVCDEPVSALDVSVQAQILNLLRDLQRERGLAYLFISHDLGVVRVMSDRIAVMLDGKIVETGAAAEVFDHPTAEYTRTLLASLPTLQHA